MVLSRFFVIAFLVATLVGCDSGGDSGPPLVDGNYEIVATDASNDQKATYDVGLSEDGEGAVTGSGTLVLEDMQSTEARTSGVSVTGGHDHPDVSLQLSIEETGAVTTFEGTLEDGDASGTLTLNNDREISAEMTKQ